MNRLGFKVLCLFLISMHISGCYSYVEISKKDYLNKEKFEKTKIVLNTKDEVIIEEPSNIEILSDGENIVITKDTSIISIPFSSVDKIMEEKFDFGKTCFATFGFTLLGHVVFALLLIILIGPINFG
ncbi:MAG TPA: hypothetical protein PK559_13055 [Ignavibacteriaceae bacterium]|nr:hypothetical protein [Ignavibacteriaceae bacterium]